MKMKADRGDVQLSMGVVFFIPQDSSFFIQEIYLLTLANLHSLYICFSCVSRVFFTLFLIGYFMMLSVARISKYAIK
jgi:hypothetical protein